MPYKDRSTGLIVFGILTILLGCMAALGIFFMLVGQAMVPADQQVGFGAILPAVAMYAVVAVALIWLGIGSIKARRWARALLLIFSWSWLLLGLIEIVAMAFILPRVMANVPVTPGRPPVPAAVLDGIMFFTFLIFAVIFLIMPAIWTFFYRSPHVKATCDARDPVPGWTDACPLPVLALSLWACLCLPMLLLMPLSGHLVMPFFGTFITGFPAAIFCLVLAALWGFSAWLLYRLDVRGWWLILIAICIGMISGLLTFSQHNLVEMYQAMNYPQAQIDQIQKSGLLQGNGMSWLMGASLVPFLGYLFFIKKYFRREG